MIRHMAEAVSAEERELVERWLQDESHLRHFEALKTVWLSTGMERPADTDADAAWHRLKQRAEKERLSAVRSIPARTRTNIARIAAMLLLAAGVYAFIRYSGKSVETMPLAQQTLTSGQEQVSPDDGAPAIHADRTAPQPAVLTAAAAPAASPEPAIKRGPEDERKPVAKEAAPHLAEGFKMKEQICNSTLCPLEICIVQSVLCENNKESAIAYCSLLQPDEAGQLHYKVFDTTAAYCQAAVKEISIRRISTGETIVLNDSSAPVTAQEFFDYITGRKKGGIEAGFFEADCNNYCLNETLTLDNRFGNLVLQ